MSLVTEKISLVRVPQSIQLKCVLIVEDNPQDVYWAERELKKLRVQNPVRSVESEEQMVAYMRGEGEYQDRAMYPLPAVIVLDMHLHNADPMEALSWLRSKFSFRNIPIIAISSPEQQRTLQKAVDLGAVSWIAKPFTGIEFRRIVAEAGTALQFDR
jgi:CheY-like chemotaxis protein